MKVAETMPSERASGLDPAAIDELRALVGAQLIAPDDREYDGARRVWNGMIDRRPALILRCRGVADVIAGVNFARAQGLPVAVRGGGHNVAGFGTCDGGMVIDLSPMRGVRVDPTARTARAGGGATWGDLDRETQVFGLAAPGGIVSTTGIGGLTLGGGQGWLRRTYGMACDSLVSADVVTADGQFVVASEAENSDLSWALRGGGGNFGVVSSFEYRLHPVGPLVAFAGPCYAPESAPAVLSGLRELAADAPDELNISATWWTIPPAPDGERGTVPVAQRSDVPKVADVVAAPHEEWFWEGNVQAAVVRHLAQDGWDIRRVADTASRERGVDIEAVRDGSQLLVEVKGYPSTTYAMGDRAGETKRTSAPLQARAYFSHALLAGVLLRADHDVARVALAFPDKETYVTLARRSAPTLAAARIEIWLVSAGGRVEAATS